MDLKEELGGFFIEKFKFFYIYIVKLVKIYFGFFFLVSMNIFWIMYWIFFFNLVGFVYEYYSGVFVKE